MKEKVKADPRETFQRRRQARSTQDLLADVSEDIDSAAQKDVTDATPLPVTLERIEAQRAGAEAEVKVKAKETVPNPNRKTIRLHSDVREAIQRRADEQRRSFTDILKEVLIAGMREKKIDLPDPN